MIQIPYVDRVIELDIPVESIAFDAYPRSITPDEDLEAILRRALADPIGTPQLRDMVNPGERVIIISDDNTRCTPTKQIIPALLDALNQAGIPDQLIQIIVSSGTHRPMTKGELDVKYGDPVLSRVPVLAHHYRDPDELVYCGLTGRGTRILVNRHVLEADFRIAVGNIVPHHPVGWSAGAKAVLPGVSGEETIAQMHLLGSRDPALGQVDTEVRREMEDFADKIGLNFILNVILNREGLLVDAVAGHFVAAHRIGVEKSKSVWGVDIPKLADITISSTSPIDFDFYQADKGLFSAEIATWVGGEIILVSGCIEGTSPAHSELSDYVGRMTNDEIWSLLHAGDVSDPLTCAEAIAINDLKDKRAVTIVSDGLAPALCNEMGFRHVFPHALHDYLSTRLEENPALKVGVLRQSAQILPSPSPDAVPPII
jgi:nickel-dependent lactate racemase